MLRSALAAILLAGFLTALLTPHISGWLAPIGAVLLALAWAIRFGHAQPLPLFATVLAISAAGIVVSVTLRYDLLGQTGAPPLSLREAAQQPARSAFRFRDAVVRAEYAAAQPVTNQRGAVLRTIRVAPLVPADWAPGEPVTFWVVADAARPATDAAQWAAAHNAALRLSGFQTGLYQQAAARAAAMHNVPLAAEPVFVHWLANPAAELAAARRMVGLQIGGIITIWLLAIAWWYSGKAIKR